MGEWFLRDAIPWDEQSVYGPWVLALSAFSEQIDEINGGQAVVALHGTSQPDKLGSAVSLGCVRLSNDDITIVASLVPVGSPVVIHD
ncbi:MAG: L,D-transpeptidase [Acidimicrobiales bacterium]